MAGNGEWKVNVPKSLTGTEPGAGKTKRMCGGQMFDKAREIAASEPKKVIHCVKVGVALSLVSLFYYMRPLYDGVGGNAMWAVMTVVVAFEYSVGATIAKSCNRVGATLIAGSLGLGVHWLANQCGQELEPLILQVSVFVIGSVATFSRFIPCVKARFDYGAMVFILTFSFVSISGYRVDKLLELARNRVSTIAIGTSICILTSMLFYPVWAGKELHDLVYHNLQKLADSLDGCVTDYFKDNQEESFSGKREGYKCVLNSRATQVAKANLARWEPAHGPFKYRHPWKQYLKIGASMRSCAYCIETLRGYINSEASGMKVPELVKEHMKQVCMALSSSSSKVLRELAITMETMRKSARADLLVHEMKFAVESFQNVLKDLSNQTLVLLPVPDEEENSRNGKKGQKKPPQTAVPIMEIFPVATMASLLIEIAERVEGIVGEVEEMAVQAKFEIVINKQHI